MGGEYAKFVDYAEIDPFKLEMVAMSRRTLEFPRRRLVFVGEDGFFRFIGGDHEWKKQPEGLGNKGGISEVMYALTRDPRHFDSVGVDTCMMGALDVARFGALPVVCGNEVAAGRSSWFADEVRRKAVIESFYEGCRQCGMAMIGGESPAYRFIVNPAPPIPEAVVYSVSVTGILSPLRRKILPRVEERALILGAKSSGLHANGASLVIDEGSKLPDGFLHVLANGRTYGEEALIPTANYIPLVEALLVGNAEILAIIPATGGGVAKLASFPAGFTYRIKEWVEYPLLFRFLLGRGISIRGCLTTFNMGIGIYFLVREAAADEVISLAKRAGYQLYYLGEVEKGERRVIFGPEGQLILPPPGQ